MTTNSNSDHQPSDYQPTVRTYLAVSAVLAAFGGILWWVTQRPLGAENPAARVVGPVVTLVALTGLVWLLMVIARNAAILKRIASAEYYVDYAAEKAPVADWVERPARTFNNLLQVPVLFYVLCLLMLQTGVVDQAQVTLAWIFVVTRAFHAAIYIGWNRGPYRFMMWMSGCLSLVVLWTRFAFQSAPLWW